MVEEGDGIEIRPWAFGKIIIIGGIGFKFTGEDAFHHQTIGMYIYPAEITHLEGACINTGQVSDVLVNRIVYGQKIYGIEMFMTSTQHVGSRFGILVKEKIKGL